MTAFATVAEVAVDPAAARVFEHGWQSWTPTATYRLDQRPWRVLDPNWFVVNYRGPRFAPPAGFHADGLLAVDPGTGEPARIWAAADPTLAVASIRAEVHSGRLVVSADGPVVEAVGAGGAGDLGTALAAWAGDYAAPLGVGPLRPAPTIWCSWYHYFTEVTEADVLENLANLSTMDLPVDVVQLDDGYQTEIGDWLTLGDRFGSLAGLVARIRDAGRRAGIWVAPFLVGANSEVAQRHPDWLVADAAGPTGAPAAAGHHWGQDLYALDPTQPGAAEWLTGVFATFAGMGIDFFKIDFCYAGALPGRRHTDLPEVAAYRRGLELIRAGIGPDAYLLGCGAPILPSIGLVDAMRVSPDIAASYEPPAGDMSAPSQRSAVQNGSARAFQHGRWWVNDPDCILARPAMQRRADWAGHVERYGGLRGSSDRLSELDTWGLETTRRLLATVPPATPFPAPTDH
jgi:alpha-galactosidase